MNKKKNIFPPLEGPICPLPFQPREKIILGHGSGGNLTQELIDNIFRPYLTNSILDKQNDFANIDFPLDLTKGRLIVATDAHIVNPIFFPGGDIGRLAICGTVNDIAMSGGKPLYLTASFIIEEGFETNHLTRIVKSMKFAADEAEIEIIAGDTKVAEKGNCDKIFISTTGIGWVSEMINIGGEKAQPGDFIIISGSIGDHGIAVLSERGDFGFNTNIQSDVAPLNGMINTLIDDVGEIHVLRDPTRGGLATSLNEIAKQSQINITVFEEKLPIKKEVKAACEMLGFDPLYIANEGKAIIILPENKAEKAIHSLRNHVYGKDAQIIGQVSEPQGNPCVVLNTTIGSTRILDSLSGELLPRIC